MNILEIKRNDRRVAMAYARQQWDAGRALTSDDLRSLIMLQDDPRAFAKAIEVEREKRGAAISDSAHASVTSSKRTRRV